MESPSDKALTGIPGRRFSFLRSQVRIMERAGAVRIFVYMLTASAMNSLAPGGNRRGSSSALRLAELEMKDGMSAVAGWSQQLMMTPRL